MKKMKHFIYMIILTLLISFFPSNISHAYEKEQIIRVGYDQNSHFIQEKMVNITDME